MADTGTNDEDLKVELERLQSQLDENRKAEAARQKAYAARLRQTAEKERDVELRDALAKTPLDPKFQRILSKAGRADLSYDPTQGKFLGPDGMSVEQLVADKLGTGGPWSDFLDAGGAAAAAENRPIEIDSIKPGANNEAARREIAKLAKEMLNR